MEANKKSDDKAVKPADVADIQKPFSVLCNEFNTEIFAVINKHGLDPVMSEILLGRIYMEIANQATNQFKIEQASYNKQIVEQIANEKA